MVKREKKNHLNSLRSNHQLCKRGVCRRRQRVPPAEHQSQVLSSNCTFSTKLFSSQSLPSQRAAGACDLKPTSPAANPTTVHATSPAPVSTERERAHKFDRMQLYISSNHCCDKTPLAYCTLPAAVHFSAFHLTQFAAIESQWVIVSAPSSCELLQKVTGT